jgi:hypothetical protein
MLTRRTVGVQWDRVIVHREQARLLQGIVAVYKIFVGAELACDGCGPFTTNPTPHHPLLSTKLPPKPDAGYPAMRFSYRWREAEGLGCLG